VGGGGKVTVSRYSERSEKVGEVTIPTNRNPVYELNQSTHNKLVVAFMNFCIFYKEENNAMCIGDILGHIFGRKTQQDR
jgi:hypothetical protein